MIVHVVLFSPRPDLAAEARQDLAAAFEVALRDIPSIRRAHVGKRMTHGRPYEQLMGVNYEYAAILEFDSLDALKAYLNHPAHEQLATRFFAAFKEALMYDFEMVADASGLRGL
jgi:antibiotic biosynthesis monooxygenase (ABM) superfamily enzyme